MLDMSDLLDDPDFIEPIKILTQSSGSYVGNRYVAAGPSALQDATASVQPISGKFYKMMPEGVRFQDAFEVWSKADLTGTEDLTLSTTFIRQGQIYKIMAIFDWGTTGNFFHYGAVRTTDIVTTASATSFKIEINTLLPGSAANTFILPLAGSGYDATITDWGDGSSEVLTTNPGDVTHVYATPGIYTISIEENTIGGFPNIFFNDIGDKEKLTNIKQWGSGQWATMSASFRGCSSLTIVTATDAPDLSNVTNMTSMFNGCESMMSLIVSDWDLSNILLLASTFNDCFGLTSLNVSNWDVSNVSNMDSLFRDCLVLPVIDVSKWTPTNITTAAHMFEDCKAVTLIDIADWQTSLNLTMFSMFDGCDNLATVLALGFDTSLVTNMASMFFGCPLLSTLDVSLWDTSNVTDLSNAFRECALLDLDVSTFDISSLTDADGLMNGSGFSKTNYDLLLVAWEGQPHNNTVPLHAGTAQYSAGAPATARGDLITDLWTITDGGLAA